MSSSSSPVLSGSCACGASTYTSTAEPSVLDYCYCKTCQRVSGTPFVPWLAISRTALTFDGPIETFRLTSVASRGHCGKCGSTLTFQYDCLSDRMHVSAGTVTHGQVPRVTAHLYVKDAPKWHVIADDGVSQWDTFDNDFVRNHPDVVALLNETT